MSLLNIDPVVLITGISAAGKSTVADHLARRFERGVHVKGDVFRRMVVSGREEMTASPSDEAGKQLRLRYRLGAETANAYLAVLAPNPETVAERERHRDKIAYRDSFHSIEQLDHALREQTPRVGLWIDSSNMTAEETVDMIIRDGLSLGSAS